MPDGRSDGGGVDGDTSVDGFIAGGAFDAVVFAPGTARSSTAGFLTIFSATFGAGFAATRAVILLGVAFFTVAGTGLAPVRDVERATEEERVERAVWAISPRAYHCPRSGVNGGR